MWVSLRDDFISVCIFLCMICSLPSVLSESSICRPYKGREAWWPGHFLNGDLIVAFKLNTVLNPGLKGNALGGDASVRFYKLFVAPFTINYCYYLLLVYYHTTSLHDLAFKCAKRYDIPFQCIFVYHSWRSASKSCKHVQLNRLSEPKG